MIRTKVFIDFWNMQLDWNEYVGKRDDGTRIQVPWTKLPNVLCQTVKRIAGDDTVYSGTHVYASVDRNGDPKLRSFLNRMDGFTGYTVVVKERKPRSAGVRCKECKKEITVCDKCKKPLRRTVEKGVDSAIITDMIQMGYDSVYDAAVLCSADADLAQAVQFIQQRIGKNVYNLWFTGLGMSLRNACWDSIRVDDVLRELKINPQGRGKPKKSN